MELFLMFQHILQHQFFQKMADPYHSIRSKIHLPKTYKIKKDIRLFPPLSRESEEGLQQLSQPLLLKTNDLVNELNESFQVYENPKTFHFKFPESLFPNIPKGQRNQITYEQKMIVEQENTFKNRLSEDQIKEIEEKGEFKVKSNLQYVTLPYVWKINESLFWGRQKVDLIWKNSLAKIYGMFIQAKNRLFNFVPRQLQKIKKIPDVLFSIIFGKKSLRVAVSVNYQHELFKDFWKKIINDHYKETQEWGSALWKYLYVYYDPELERPPIECDNQTEMARRRQKKRIQKEEQIARVQASNEKKNKIKAVDARFNQQWAKLRKKVILQIGEQMSSLNNSVEQKPQSQQQLLVNSDTNSNDEKNLDLLAQKKFSLYVDFMKNQLPKENIPLNVINAILIMLRLFKVINSRYQKKSRAIEKKRRQIQASIRRLHPIKSLYAPFFSQKVEGEVKVISNALNEELYHDLLNEKDFSSLLNEQQKTAYKEYIKLRLNYNILQSGKRNQLKQLHEPSRIFYSNHLLLPPYKIIKNGDYYELKKVSDDLTVDTNTNFWKFKLYWMRMKTWSINCFIFLIYIAWNGPTGLRCLLGKADFGYEMAINFQTGEQYYHMRKTVIGQFLQVMEGIDKSRRNFEEQPDLGLLGKNVSRIFNYAECYIFRFLIVGIIIVLIGYPIIIVLFSFLSTVLILTVWAWVPIVLIVTYAFNIFIYQFQSALIPDRKIVRSFPIIGIVYHIIKTIVITLLLILNIILWTPFKALFIFLFCFCQRIFRKTLDKIMLTIFRKVGRTPSRDTSIARKISGPGMSKEFYMSINEEDVYVLIRSQLQQIYMTKFNNLMIQEIQKNSQRSTNIMNMVLKPFNARNDGLGYIIENTNLLNQHYNDAYYHYMARYPTNPYRVRFTQEEIDSYFENTVSIVKNFVVKNQIQKWIFEEFELYEDMYDELTRSIWMRVFGCGEEIFEPLEKLDARFKLEDQYNDEDGFNYARKKNVGNIMKSLEGQVTLNHHKQKLSPFKHNLLHRERRIEGISSILNFYDQNSYTNVNLDLQNVQSLFVPNLNINEIIIVESERRQRNIRNSPNIVDL